MRTTTTWKKEHEFESVQHHHVVLTDSKEKKGSSPKSLLLSALASCSGIDVVDILQKMRVEFSELRIDVEANQTEGQPRVFKEFNMTFHLKTSKENRDKIKKAVDLSLDKYCGVAAMLRKHANIRYEIVISE